MTIVDDAAHTTYEIANDISGIPTIKYIQIEAENESDQIFSQPIRFVIEEFEK